MNWPRQLQYAIWHQLFMNLVAITFPKVANTDNGWMYQSIVFSWMKQQTLPDVWAENMCDMVGCYCMGGEL